MLFLCLILAGSCLHTLAKNHSHQKMSQLLMRVDPFDIEMEANDDLGSEKEFNRQQNESEARVNIKIEQSTQKRYKFINFYI